MKVGDTVRFFDSRVDHLKGCKGDIVANHESLNCFTISYTWNGIKGELIQVNKCQVMKEK